MLLAESKRQKNISEYLIYMYQTEDLIRIYEFDMEKIKEYVIKHIPMEDKSELVGWYKNIAEQMKKEGVEKEGHLAKVQKVVGELEEMKTALYKTDSEFKILYDQALPHINDSLEYAKGKFTSEIQACLNGIYGLLLVRMKGQEVPSELMEGINTFGDVLSYLSYKYKQKHFMNEN